MAFETSTLVNGEWTTRTLDVDTVLRHYDQQDKEANANVLEVEKAPVLGLLTQTVIRSPLVHWILPARLRSPNNNDVAFIGDEFVQIKELRADGFLWDVVRKENFGARIRNARVVGSLDAYNKDQDIKISGTQIKDEDGDIDMAAGEVVRKSLPLKDDVLPPQFILLQLDTGDSIFLMLRQSASGKLEFISSRHRVSKAMLKLQPGMHLAVDPSSRYMAIGCSEGLFAIYALHPRDELKRRYSQEPNLHLVRSEVYIPCRGALLKMEFLYPSPDDDSHVILIVLMVIKGRTRMFLYEWDTGIDDLKKIRPHNHRGHELPRAHQMPLLLIPLRFKTAFLLASEKSMVVCNDILTGFPVLTEFNTIIDPPTKFHHGLGAPLWAAWTRPDRSLTHRETRDDIYIVREDGLVKFLEIDSVDFVQGDMEIGNLEGNCGTALASLDYDGRYSKTGDILITGGDSGAGGAYLVKAREAPIFTQPIHNWTPAHDLVTTGVNRSEVTYPEVPVGSQRRGDIVPTPSKIFTCVGKGSKGGITELRYGLEARLGLEMKYNSPIMEVWDLSTDLDQSDSDDGFFFLLSLAGSSAVLHLSADESEITALDEYSTKLDLRYRTIAAATQGRSTIQVTERSIVISEGSQSCVYQGESLLSIHYEDIAIGSGTTIGDVIISDDTILFATYFDNATYLKVLDLEKSGTLDGGDHPVFDHPLTPRTMGKFSPHVTSLALCRLGQILCAVVAEWTGDSITLRFQPISGSPPANHILDASSTYGDKGIVNLEAIVSMVVAPESSGNLVLLCGTRNGLLLTLEIDPSNLQVVSGASETIGATSVTLKRDEYCGSRTQFSVSCDSKVYTLTTREVPIAGSRCWNWGRRSIIQIWLTDALRPDLQQPRIMSVARQRPRSSAGIHGRLLLVSGKTLLLADLGTEVKAVPRHIRIGGTPTRLFYSHNLEVLVVAASVNGKSTLLFIDPETGEDLSSPLERHGGLPADFVSGLGNPGERVFRLFEWSYVKAAQVWNFIIASTNTGRLLIISVENQELIQKEISRPREVSKKTPNGQEDQDAMSDFSGSDTSESDIERRSKIEYYTRHKFKCPEPVYSVTSFADGLLWCSGEKLFCDILENKKFKRVAEYELPSPARSLKYQDGIIYALTNEHSLEVLRLVTDSGSYKIVRTHGDRISRFALHHAILDRTGDRPIHLLSDKHRSVVGLWPTENTKADTLETVFEGQLPYSVLRFRSANCRPTWDPVWNSNLNFDGISPHSMSQPEVLGLSIDGSLSNHTILEFHAWKFLRFLINLCIRSPTVCEFTYLDDSMPLDTIMDPKIMMHVDGDILKRCLEDRKLEELLRLGENTEEAARIFSKFCEVLQELHHGSLEGNTAPGVYVDRAYMDLAFYLRPVL